MRSAPVTSSRPSDAPNWTKGIAMRLRPDFVLTSALLEWPWAQASRGRRPAEIFWIS